MLYDRNKIFFIILLTVLTSSLLHAQQTDSLIVADSISLNEFYDSLADSIMVTDSLRSDTLLAQQPEGTGIEAQVKYNANDSLIFALDGGAVELYGKASIAYDDITLEADYIRYDMDLSMVTANGLPDSSGTIAGKPVFKDANSSFESKSMKYNFKTRKAYVEEVITQQEGGFLHAKQTKKQNNGHVHLKDGKYTTCDAEHPHFYIAITKGISMPGDKIVAGPAYIVLADVPLPLGLPFGFFPNSQTKTSGLLIPKYGEEDRRGFYLKEGGYYFAMNDYMDLRLTGDIYSNGTWGVRMGSNYKWNYRFSGNLNVRYFKNVSGYKDVPDTYSTSKDYAIGWSHSQDSRANPNSSFRASVNLSSSSYDQNHSNNINNVMRNTKQSSISYTKAFPNSPFNLSASLNHNQNSSNQTVNMSLPKISFNMTRITPFKRKVATGPKRFWEDIQFSYTSLLENRVNTFDTLLFTSEVWDDMQNGFKHNIPLSLSIRPFRKTAMLQSFSINPSLNYNGVLYSKQTEYFISGENYIYDDQGNIIGQDHEVSSTQVAKISYAQSLFPSIGAGLAPKLYGMFTFRGKGRMEQIRHVMTPTIGASYVPDMSSIQADYYTELVDPETGDTLVSYSIYEDQIYGTPTSRGASGSLNFSLRNNIEAKMRSKVDTIEELEKVKILDNLSFNTSLNLYHTDTLTPAWTPVTFNGSTRLFKEKLNLTFRGSMDPFGYDTVLNLNRTAETWFSQTGKPLRLTSASVSAGFNLKSKKENTNSKAGQEDMDRESQLNSQNMSGDDATRIYDPNLEEYYGDYVDFDIPWTLRVDYSFSYTKPREDIKIVQTLRASGDFSLTENWKIGFNTGYDLDKKQFTTTNLSIYRDLHCWEMRISVVPFGNFKSYNFQINAKSSILADLKYNKRKNWQDNIR